MGFLKNENYFLKMEISSAVYSLADLYAAAYLFLDKVYFYFDKNRNGDFCVYLFPRKGRKNIERIGHEFINNLFNYAHYNLRVKRESEIIKIFMQRAFVSAAPSLLQEAEEKEIEEIMKSLEAEKK